MINQRTTKNLRFRADFVVLYAISNMDKVFKYQYYLSDEDVMDPPTDIHVSFRENGTKFLGDLTWNVASLSKQHFCLAIWLILQSTV